MKTAPLLFLLFLGLGLPSSRGQDCSKVKCLGNRECQVSGSTAKCQCKSGWKTLGNGDCIRKDPCAGECGAGQNCSADACGLPLCSCHNRCSPDPQGKCDATDKCRCPCPSGTKPTATGTCKRDCSTTVCGQNQECKMVKGVPECHCKPGFQVSVANKTNCISPPCKTNVCLHGGTCVPVGDWFYCMCTKFYTGEFCEYVRDCNPDNVDMVFVVDASGSIELPKYGGAAGNFGKVKNFIADLVNQFKVGTEFARLGMVVFSNSIKLWMQLNQFNDKQSAMTRVRAAPYEKLGTDIAGGMEKARTQMFGQSQDRSSAPNVMMVFTDGQQTAKGQSPNPAARLNAEIQAVRKTDITVLGIGVGGAKRDQLVDIAGDEKRYQKVTDFKDLTKMTAFICNAVKASQKKVSACSFLQCDIEFKQLCGYNQTTTGQFRWAAQSKASDFGSTYKIPNSAAGTRFLGVEPLNGQAVMASAKFNNSKELQLSFKYFEAAEKTTFKICLDTLTHCPFESNMGANPGDLRWRYQLVKIPPRTTQLFYVAENAGGPGGPIGLDDISCV